LPVEPLFGINDIDVAVDYGEAEEHIGRCNSSRRQEFFLASPRPARF
jgi:hypothetical protein